MFELEPQNSLTYYNYIEKKNLNETIGYLKKWLLLNHKYKNYDLHRKHKKN